jgi:hypothetical protein
VVSGRHAKLAFSDSGHVSISIITLPVCADLILLSP